MKKILTSTLLATIMMSTQAQAESTTGFSLGGQVGLYGLGVNFKGKFSDTLGVKVGFEQFTYKDIDLGDEKEDYETDFDAETKAILATVDWHPFAGIFAIRGGVIVNDSNVLGDIKPKSGDAQVFRYNGVDYDLNELGSIKTKVDFDPVAPYIGLGWDASFASESGFGFTFDLGVAKQGAAKSSYKLIYGDALDFDKEIQRQTKDIPESEAKTQKIAEIKAEIEKRRAEIDKELRSEIDKEMDSVQDELDKHEWLPYVAFGVNYKF